MNKRQHRRTATRFLIGVILSAAAFSAGAQLYRWTDESGRTHFTDTPPPPSAKNVQKRRGTAASSAADSTGQPFALQQARKDFPVTLYTAPGCDACAEARKLLNARGIPFREVSVSTEARFAELKNAVGGDSAPAMIVGSSVLKGFEQGSYHRTLDAAGYPKTGILPPRNQAEPEAPETEVNPAEPPPAPTGPYAPRREPPPGPAAAEPTGPAGKQPALSPEAAFQKRRQEAKEGEEKAAKERADAEARKENCAGAQASLRRLESGQRLQTMNAQGERVFIDDAQRAQEIERARRAVSNWCG